VNLNASQPDALSDDHGASAPDRDVTLPLGIGAAAEDMPADTFGSSASVRKFKSGTLLLTLVIGLGAGGLVVMRMITRITAHAGAQTTIETTIDEFLKAVDQPGNGDDTPAAFIARNEQVLEVLSDDFTDRQVPLADVQRDPFVIFANGPIQPAIVDDGSTAAHRALEQRRQERLRLIDTVASRLRLQSVIMSAEPLAHLNGQVVRVGDRLKLEEDGLRFTVTAIGRQSVTYLAEDVELQVSVEKVLSLQRHEP
jgi:hypothetical protein